MRLLAYGICALFTAAVGDTLVEALGNARILGTGVDNHHESLLPTLAVACVLLGALAVRIAHGRLGVAHDDWVIAFARRCAPVSIGSALAKTIGLALAIVTAMESYESLFGGGPPFDALRDSPGSALVSLIVYGACALLATIALQRVASALCAACDALRAIVELPIARRFALRYQSRRSTDDAEILASHAFPPRLFGERAPPRTA